MWQYTPLSVLSWAAAGLCALIALAAWRRRSAPGARFLVLLMLGIGWWSFTSGFEMARVDLPGKMFWNNAEYLGIPWAPLFWLGFLLTYTGNGGYLTWRNVLLACIVPAGAMLLAWTNEAHHLYYLRVGLVTLDGFVSLDLTHGVPWSIFVAYTQVVLLGGLAFLVRYCVSSHRQYIWQCVSIMVGALAPIAGNVLYVLGLTPAHVDVTPLAFSLSGLALLWALARHRFLVLGPIAREAVFESTPDAVIVLDQDRRIVDLNPSACALLRCAPATALGRHAADVTGHARELASFLASVDEGQADIRLGPGGAEPVYEVRITPFRDGHGSRQGWVLSGHDISRRKRLEARMVDVRKLEAVGQLAAGVAHDYNNLLTAILGYAKLALQDMPEGAAGRGDIELIVRNAQRAAELTRHLLTFSRREVAAPQPMDLNDLLQETGDMLRHLLGKPVKLTMNLAEGLWPIYADPAQLQQILVNLASNARDAQPEGGSVTVETANVHLDGQQPERSPQTPAGDYVRLSICDEGVGMSAEVKAHLFEPYFTTKEVGKGSGLGLATVYGMVQQHGGGIGVCSEPGQGTTFHIYLPRLNEGDTGPAVAVGGE